jgi:hypothetical protein
MPALLLWTAARRDHDAEGRTRLLYVVEILVCLVDCDPVEAGIDISSNRKCDVPLWRNRRTIVALATADVIWTTTSAILVPPAAPESTFATLDGDVYEVSADARLATPILGTTANAGLVAIYLNELQR